MRYKRPGYEVFKDHTQARVFECHLYIVSISTTRQGLVSAYIAAKKSLRSPFLVAMVVTAIRERQAAFLDHKPVHFQVEEI